jgi:hypothetical protein
MEAFCEQFSNAARLRIDHEHRSSEIAVVID